MTDVRESQRELLAGAAVLGAVSVLVGADLILDYGSGTSFSHVVAELVAVGGALSGAVYLFRRVYVLRRDARLMERDLSHARAEAERWRAEAKELLKGLSAAVDRQFDRWALTAAEREVGLLLLKGLSHKEIAGLRETTERTVRQQALGLYRKAGLSGRAELAAFFFEDLLTPGEMLKD
ncbi:MAG: LuxR family transcriptional regulator [Bdellovibrionota bacterium]